MAKPFIHAFEQRTGFIPTLAVTLWLGVNGLLIYGLIALYFMNNTQRTVTLTAMAILAVLPLPKSTDEHKFGYKLGDWICKQAAHYFGLTVTVENVSALKKIEKDGKGLVFGHEPHNILPYPIFAFNDALGVIPHVTNCFGMMTSSIFNVPILRHIYTYTRGSPVDKATFNQHLVDNHTVIVVPGGVNEVFLMDQSKPNEIALFLKKRKGFIKLALKNDTPVVPCFSFGLNGSYKFCMPAAIYRHPLALKISKMLGFIPVLFFGRGYVPFGIPFPNKTNVVIGEPLVMEKVEGEVSDAVLDKYHTLFIEKLVDLFERHKGKNEGYANKLLVIQ